MNDAQKISQQFDEEIKNVNALSQLEEVQIKYLGRNGLVNGLLQKIKDVEIEEKRELGNKINSLKTEISNELTRKKQELLLTNKKEVVFDTTLPGIKPQVGHLHPNTVVLRKLTSFFKYLGYSIYEGPEIETDEYCFEKLNIPKDHPARELTDTLYIKQPEILLRVHTSSVETRAMTQEKVPLRLVIPGKVYRNETENATNNSMFYQFEGLAVDKNLSLADLKGTLIAFVKFLYGEDTITRFRCKYYPQVEPGAGLDVQCTFCHGKGCQVCKYRGFIEVLGAGMVHPNVLKNCNIDPEIWSGFAFGIGFDRLVMLQYGITDIRKLYSGELVFKD